MGPWAAVDGQEPEDLAAVVRDLIEEELERYFDVLLPARIDADFRGNGYEMLSKIGIAWSATTGHAVRVAATTR